MSIARDAVRACVLALFLMICLPGAPVAQEASQPDPWPIRTADQVATRLQACGYVVQRTRAEALELERLRPWRVEWTSLTVRDPGEAGALDGRVLSVWVFPDEARAVMLHLDLHLRDEQIRATPLPWSADHGPTPGAGQGGTVWRGNVALAQLSAMLPDEAALGRAPRPRFRDQPRDQAPYAVDRDFVECLGQS